MTLDRSRAHVSSVKANARHLRRLTQLVSSAMPSASESSAAVPELAKARESVRELGVAESRRSGEALELDIRVAMTESRERGAELREAELLRREQRLRSRQLEWRRVREGSEEQFARRSQRLAAGRREVAHLRAAVERLAAATQERAARLDRADLELQTLFATLRSTADTLLVNGGFVDSQLRREVPKTAADILPLVAILRTAVFDFNQALYTCTAQLRAADVDACDGQPPTESVPAQRGHSAADASRVSALGSGTLSDVSQTEMADNSPVLRTVLILATCPKSELLRAVASSK